MPLQWTQQQSKANRAWQSLPCPCKGSILGFLQHQPQRKSEHLQFLGAHLCNKKEMDRPCPLTPINSVNLPWIFSIFKSRCAALSLISLSFEPLEGVWIFLSPQMEILHKCGPQQETIQDGIKEPFIKLKRINAFLSAKALHVSQLKQFIKGEGFLFKIQVKPNYPTWNLKLFVWDQNWMKQLPQYHVLECQCMNSVDKEATGKRERFWCLTSQASAVCNFLGQGNWSATKDHGQQSLSWFQFS